MKIEITDDNGNVVLGRTIECRDEEDQKAVIVVFEAISDALNKRIKNSERAKKAWATRRTIEKGRRSLVAKKAWKTRKANQKKVSE